MSDPTAIRRLAETYWAREMANDVPGILACYVPDATLVLPDGETLRGADEIASFYARAAVDFPRRTVRIIDQIDGTDGRTVLLWAAELFDETGARSLLQGMNVVRVEDGRFAHLQAAYPAPRLADDPTATDTTDVLRTP